MPRYLRTLIVVPSVCLTATAVGGTWVTYTNETSVRLVSNDPLVGATDDQEKDNIVGDVDQDGDDDLIVVRKQEFTSGNGRRNVLFMNEGLAEGHDFEGVLVDRTTTLAPDFLDVTNDRDVELADVNGDGWLDIITCTTLGGIGNPKSMTHPRIYINQQNDVGGNWQGFVYDNVDRVPTMPFEPRFCGMTAGDIDNDGDVDLYFVDYSTGPYARAGDLDDRLWINDGTGVFTDESALRMSSAMLASDFGASAEMADMNGDGWLDIVKTSGGNGLLTQITNDGNGFFSTFETVLAGAVYHAEVGHLNNDGMLDIVIADDGVDRYFLNTGNGGDGQANYTSSLFPGVTDNFGSDLYINDFDGDGLNDVIICDVDVDIPGCARTTHLLHNVGSPSTPSFVADAGNIPQSQRTGVHDVAIIDLNGDGSDDMVIGRCSGTQVWINSPPVGIFFIYPGGIPEILEPEVATTFQIDLQAFGDTIVGGTETIVVSTNGGPFVSSLLTPLGGSLFEASISGGSCSDHFDFYVTADLSGGLTFNDPATAPVSVYTAVTSTGLEVVFQDTIEGDVSGWNVVDGPGLIMGTWEQAEPNGTFSIGGQPVAPNNDATPDPGVMAFVTQNGLLGEPIGANDVDGGPTVLTTPVFDIDGTDAVISYERWFVSIGGLVDDGMTVEISNNGGANWTLVETVSDTLGWENNSFLVSQFVTPTATVQLRFSVCDCPDDLSSTEAGIDDLTVSVLCAVNCAADIDDDGTIGISDLLTLLGAWGTDPGGPPDLDGDGNVGISDLLDLLAQWGPCP